MPDTYPAQVDVEYPDRPLNRLTTGLRIFTIIPIAIVLGTVSGETWNWYGDNGATHTGRTVVVGAGGLLFAGPLLMILFRQKYRAGGLTGTSSSRGSPHESRSTAR